MSGFALPPTLEIPTAHLPMRCLLLLFFVTATYAADDDLRRQVAAIAAIPDSVQRLAAFDAFAQKIGVAPGAQQTQETAGKWKLSVETSPVDDTQTVTGRLTANEEVGAGYRRGRPVLFLRYMEGRVDAYIDFNLFLGSDSIGATVRFGKEAAIEQTWWISTDHKAAFYKGDVAGFMKKISEVDSFLVRMTPYSESPVTVSFSTAGAGKVIDAIKAAQVKKK